MDVRRIRLALSGTAEDGDGFLVTLLLEKVEAAGARVRLGLALKVLLALGKAAAMPEPIAEREQVFHARRFFMI